MQNHGGAVATVTINTILRNHHNIFASPAPPPRNRARRVSIAAARMRAIIRDDHAMIMWWWWQNAHKYILQHTHRVFLKIVNDRILFLIHIRIHHHHNRLSGGGRRGSDLAAVYNLLNFFAFFYATDARLQEVGSKDNNNCRIYKSTMINTKIQN